MKGGEVDPAPGRRGHPISPSDYPPGTFEDELAELPVAGAAPGWMSEKAVAIGHCLVASGVPVAFGVGFPTLGSERTTQFLCEEIEGLTGGKWIHEPDRILIQSIEEKRKRLKLQDLYA